MKFPIIIAFLLSVSAAMAQKADIEVSYDWTSYDRTGKQITRQMTLLAGPEMSKLYNKPGEYVDSLRATPSGIKQYQDMASAYMAAGKLSSLPQKNIYLYVVRNNTDSTVTVYDGIEEIGEYKFVYEEPLESQNWEIMNDSTMSILGYECIKAAGTWRGRTWNVWFSPEIPSDGGPWKLCGLPGLILAAEDTTAQHKFLATGIVNSDKGIISNPGNYTYEKSSRKDMLRILRKWYEYPIEVFNALAEGAFAGEHSTPISEECDFLETDYR